MNKIIIISCLLLANYLIPNANATDVPKANALKNSKINMYSDYFGFSDLRKYLQFANKTNRMMDGHVPAQLSKPILDDPLWLEHKAKIERGETTSELEKTKLKALLLARKEALLNYVGIPDGQYKYFDRYIDFANSSKRYSILNNQIDESGKSTTLAQEDTITVYCDDLCERQVRADEIYARLLIWSLAVNSGIENYREFIVIFDTSSTAELWKGNNFSGAWKIKNLDSSALCKYSPGACDL